MLQIKTIVSGKIPEFDEEVNDAIANGWRLVKRECLLISKDRAPMLYAELEREIEKVCDTCKYDKRRGSEEPCRSCILTKTPIKWEATL